MQNNNFGDITMINALNDYSRKLTEAVKLMGHYGREYAAAERDYKIALAQEALRLKSEGMAVTLIDKVVYGHCAKERFARDSAEVMYKTAQENIQSIKLQIRILENQIQREWGMTGRGGM